MTMLRKTRAGRAHEGFTLVELMIVMLIIGVLLAIAVPKYEASIRLAREAVLKEDLQTMRKAIDSYTLDKQKGPQGLDDLVQAGYLKSIPMDPVTHRSDTWMTSQDDAMHDLDQTEPGIDNVHSVAQETSTDGSSYSTW